MKISKIRSGPVRHLGHAIGGTLAGAAFAALAGARDPIQFFSFATAYAALFYLAAALLIGPLRVLRGNRPLVSSRTRRDVGIWSGIFALLHVAFGLNVHFGGDFSAYFFQPPGTPGWSRLRRDPFGITNDLGLAATVAVAVLLALSNDLSLRKLGTKRWKNLQRLAYPLFAAVVIHAAIYQIIEHRITMLMGVLILTAGSVAVLQMRGFAARRRGVGPNAP